MPISPQENRASARLPTWEKVETMNSVYVANVVPERN